MSKGSSPAGNTTVTQNTVNPTQQVQLPYLTGAAGLNNPNNPSANFGWNQAINLAGGDPYQYYPGQTLANFDPNIAGGYQQLIGKDSYLNQIAGVGNNAFNYGTGGGYSVGNSPAFSGLNLIAAGKTVTPQVQALNQVGGTAFNGNPSAMNQLSATANGAYLGANPYLAAEYKAAAQPVINAYQTATAPQTDSNFEASGRYGSGALANAQSQNQLNLGTTLGNLSANLYGQDYANERGLQTNAANALGQLQNQSMATAANAFGNSGQLGLGQVGQQNTALGTLQSGYQAGNTATNQALLMEPNVLSGNNAGPNALVQGGQGLTGLSQAQIQDAMNRFYGNIQAPWTTNEQYLNQIGQPTGGSSFGTTTSPYFQNGLANALGAGVGGLGLLNGAKTAFGNGGILSGIFGGAAAPAAGFDAAGVALPGVTDFAGGGDLGAKGAKTAASLVP